MSCYVHTDGALLVTVSFYKKPFFIAIITLQFQIEEWNYNDDEKYGKPSNMIWYPSIFFLFVCPSGHDCTKESENDTMWYVRSSCLMIFFTWFTVCSTPLFLFKTILLCRQIIFLSLISKTLRSTKQSKSLYSNETTQLSKATGQQ